MSLFAFSVNDKVLHVLENEAAVRALCLPEAIAAQAWLLFAADGSALRAAPNLDGSAGYFLRPWASCGACSLAQVLPMASAVSGAGFVSVQALAESIAAAAK